RRDVHERLPGETLLEKRIDRLLDRARLPIRAATLLLFCFCVWLVYGAGPQLLARAEAAGHPVLAWLIPLALGCLVHGQFAFVVHEATHNNVLGKRFDRWLGNAAIGLLLLPFLSESYQELHLLHHRIPNRAGDTNWTPYRHALWKRSRLLYALYELVPVVNNLDRIRDKVQRDRRKVALSWACAIAVYLLFRPTLPYWLAVVVGLNTTNACRLWVEHFGHYRGRVSNAYWCPLGFGIGNHEVHHTWPRISALALLIGLWFREKDGSVFTSPFRLLFARDWAHFRTAQPDFDGTNV
ncbi:MAG: fatty acid desaturase, partial [Myxococcales bacterium]